MYSRNFEIYAFFSIFQNMLNSHFLEIEFDKNVSLYVHLYNIFIKSFLRQKNIHENGTAQPTIQ